MSDRFERVLFVHAHPDDETLWTGAAIASVVASGGEAVVATCTLGERGGVRAERRELVEQIGVGEVRRLELEQALHALGAAGRRIHGFADSGERSKVPGAAATEPSTDAVPAVDAPPTALALADSDTLADAIGVVVEDIAPTAIVTYDDDGGNGYPDHVAVHNAAVIVANRFSIPMYLRTDRASDRAFELAPVRTQVESAFDAYRSQLTRNGDEIEYVGGRRQSIARIEHYRLIEPWPSRRLRWLTGLGALAAGVLVGAIGTFSHQSLPWGITLSLVAATALIVGVRAASGSRGMTLLTVLGLVGVVTFVAMDPLGRGAFGAERAMIPSNPAGLAWSIVPVVVAFLALAWPSAEAMRRIRMGRASSEPQPGGPTL